MVTSVKCPLNTNISLVLPKICLFYIFNVSDVGV